MARKPKVEPTTFQIIDIEYIPLTFHFIASLQFKRGTDTWFKAFKVQRDKPTSLEQFIEYISDMDIEPPSDDYAYQLKQNMGKDIPLPDKQLD